MNINPCKISNYTFRGNLNNDTPYKTCEIKKKHSLSEKTIPVQIYKTDENKSAERYEMRLNDKVIGEISLTLNPDSVFVSNLESYSRHKYKGIGTNLIQVAIERSIEDGNSGKVTLNAKPLHQIQMHPQKFYKKMGFKEVPTKDPYENFYGVPMRLDVLTNFYWINKIKN